MSDQIVHYLVSAIAILATLIVGTITWFLKRYIKEQDTAIRDLDFKVGKLVSEVDKRIDAQDSSIIQLSTFHCVNHPGQTIKR